MEHTTSKDGEAGKNQIGVDRYGNIIPHVCCECAEAASYHLDGHWFCATHHIVHFGRKYFEQEKENT